MRRLDKQILIRTDERVKKEIIAYCEENAITLHELLTNLLYQIEIGAYKHDNN